VWTSKLKLSKISKKYSKNTSVLYKIPFNTPRNTSNYRFNLDPLSKIWSQIELKSKKTGKQGLGRLPIPADILVPYSSVYYA